MAINKLTFFCFALWTSSCFFDGQRVNKRYQREVATSEHLLLLGHPLGRIIPAFSYGRLLLPRELTGGDFHNP
ncbi:hypothetical protein KAW18_09415 [candidate division WOR-3 bacterium]|nr:hypothetical protein [candidate division WOR-3 bacterium]